uniref:Uncharacterized protein n=1 Tax=Amphiprion percula TaxID=161767 RepID=A0A3P8T8W2_AMPPE
TEEHKKVFFGEDIHINVPPGNFGEVVFKPAANGSSEVFLMKAGQVMNYTKTPLKIPGHLVLRGVQEEDEGVYTIRNTNNSDSVKHLILEVRQTTEPPLMVLYNKTTVLAEEYVGRLSVSEKRVTLHSVRMTDEGSFTVLDQDGNIKIRECLNVKHQNFLRASYGENLKMRLYLHYSNLNIVYRPKSDNQDRVILDQGVLVTPLDPQLEGRLTVERSDLIIKKIQMADAGVFKVTDLAGFSVADIYIDINYKLPPLTVAILSLIGLIAFMLLVCLLSCLYKVHKRNEKNKKLTLLAQQAGKGDGDAFRQLQVVHEAYSRFTEESLMQSVSEKPSESTEVTIKGLEVSKPGRYQALNSDNFLEMSDSGVEFTTSGIPLDSDTDAA